MGEKKKNTLQKLLDTAKVELIKKLIAVNTYIKKGLKSITQASTVRNYKEMKLKPSEKNIKIKSDKNEREQKNKNQGDQIFFFEKINKIEKSSD